MRKNKVIISIIITIFCLCAFPKQINIGESNSTRLNIIQAQNSIQDEILIVNRTAPVNGIGMGPQYNYSMFYVVGRFQLFERFVQSLYHYRIFHRINYSIEDDSDLSTFNLTAGLSYAWHYENQAFLYYRIDNITLDKSYTTLVIINYTFSTPSPIDGISFDLTWAYTGTGTGLRYQRSTQPFKHSPTIFVPNLNQFTYNLTVITDTFSYCIQKDVIWANTSISVILGTWKTSVLTYDANFDQTISVFTIRSAQYLLGCGTGVFIKLNKTTDTTDSRNLYLYDMNHTSYELTGVYHILISDEVERGRNILIDDELTYNDHLWINYLSNSNTPLTIDFDFDVLQKLPLVQIEIRYTMIYVTAGFVGGVGVTILGVIIRNHYLKKRNKVLSISTIANVNQPNV